MPRDRAAIERFSSLVIDVLGRLDALEACARRPETVVPLAQTDANLLTEPLRVTEGDIRAAYRLFLGRNADASGLQYHFHRAGAEEFSLDDLVNNFRDSDEYMARRAKRLTSVDVDGLQIAIDPDEPEFGRAIVRDGLWEAHVMQQIAANLRPGGVFVDIGANVGIMSFVAARAVGTGGKVIAFEPNPDNIQCFLQGVLLNAFEQVMLFPLAASSADSLFAIRGGSNTYVSKANVGGRLVQSVKADILLQNEPRIDLIKIDIEGHEPQALAGLTKTLERHRPLLLCEFNPRCLRENVNADPADFAAYIFKISERVAIIEHDGSLTMVLSPIKLMGIWHARNAEHVAAGDLEDGMVHFDILVYLR